METELKVTVLGAGHGGLTFTGDLILRGYDVTLYELPRFIANIKPILDRGGFEIHGHDGLGKPLPKTGFAKISKVTTNIKEAVEGVNVILVNVPAFAHKEFAEKLSPELEKGQIVTLNPGSQFGAIEFGNVLKKKGVDIINEVILCETMSNLYATRKFLFRNENLYRVWVMATKAMLPIAAFPSINTEKAMKVLQGLYHNRLILASNVLETSIYSMNAYGHPLFMILGAIDMEAGEEPEWSTFDERKKGSQALNNVRTAVRKERDALLNAMNLEVKEFRLYPKGWWDPPYKNEFLPPPYEIGGNKLKMRYLTEDVPYGLVPVASISRMLKVPTPTIDTIIQLASIINQTDYWKEGRTVEKLGINGLNIEQLHRYANKGKL
ncbi:MAG: NAD/NADP octopine/nopaline dehydrogenase family protein [Candidatus Helarchaeota archaeon]|nr:NAD/NADP octopine/nopaline dehydrogenase family protein [Candidatus Helarchaeota archaeon]